MNTLPLDDVKLILKEIIVNDLDANIQMKDIGEDQSLYEDGIGLDSINLVNFIMLVEEKFNISFDQDQLNAATFSNIHNLATHINARLVVQ